MYHVTTRDLIPFTSGELIFRFILTTIFFSLSISALFISPAIKHLKWKIVYVVKLLYCSVALFVSINALWWVEWFCGSVLCLEHYSGADNKVVVTDLTVHLGLSAIKILYTAKIGTNVIDYYSVFHHSWDGLIFQLETDNYNKKLRQDISTSPLPVKWVLEQFQANKLGPQYGFQLQRPFFLAKTILGISTLVMILSWLHIMLHNFPFGSTLLALSGLMNLANIFIFVFQTYRINFSIIIGIHRLNMEYSNCLWILAFLSSTNILLGLIIFLCDSYWKDLLPYVFLHRQVEFVPTEVEAITTKTAISDDSISDILDVFDDKSSHHIVYFNKTQNDNMDEI